MKTFAERLASTRARIAASAHRHGRDPESIGIVAVSKRQPVDAIRSAVAAGHTIFGENYLQEAVEKITALAHGPQLSWHFIGPVQSNKCRAVAEHFDWVHSLDREKIARRLSGQRPPQLSPLNVCIQVNTSAEASKAGLEPAAVPELAAALSCLPGIRLRGLMTLPAPETDFERQRLPFRRLHALAEQLKDSGLALDTLSMGTSADFEAAIAEGATLIRIGTELFGPRPT